MNCLLHNNLGFVRNIRLSWLSLVDYLTYKLDTGKIPANIYIDLSKAFDTLSHSILLHKRSYYGVKGIAYSLIQSYLTQRQQIVEYNRCKSKKMLITTGNPQGSVLFSICINDLPLCSKIFEMIMYADDTTLYCDIHGVPNIQHLLNAELSKISHWLAANKLSLNVSETKLMIFHSDKKKVLYPKLFINNSEIERVDSFNFLELQLHHNLNWTKHINYISLKMSKIIGIIYKLKSVFPTAILRSIYNTLLLLHMSYCIYLGVRKLIKFAYYKKRLLEM